MMTSLGYAAAGIYNAAARFEASARRTVDTTVDARAVEPVEQIAAKQAFSANTATIRTADQMIGTLLDMKA
jgi:flagellar hook protein FlgE